MFTNLPAFAKTRARVRARCGECSECPSAAKKSENKFNPRHPGRARPRSRSRLRVFRCIRYIGRGHGRGRGHVFATFAAPPHSLHRTRTRARTRARVFATLATFAAPPHRAIRYSPFLSIQNLKLIPN